MIPQTHENRQLILWVSVIYIYISQCLSMTIGLNVLFQGEAEEEDLL